MTPLIRVLLACLLGACLTAAPALAKGKDLCAVAKTKDACFKKKDCSWSGKTCAKTPVSAAGKKAASPKSAGAAPVKKPAAKKPEDTKPEGAGEPPLDEEAKPDAQPGDEDF
jgi:hypothetical protein